MEEGLEDGTGNGGAKKIVLRKIALLNIMATLRQIFEMGADYVDIQGVSDPGEEHDILLFYVDETYMKDYVAPKEGPKETIKDINDLLNYI